ncbi:flagellar FliJ family protein [Blastococcus haudaquaticus]|uniref:Flagellar FliJ protein n=1 Tax=Blastococcus haudaquaticus TaxID=1938745 RepID=A0A286H1I9_9ACTN|nr:flagellar FliJ family protein [Blastococcus haudaquaticus]SOE01174.1 flagellar export protein FliJ [Blastococcus haudaquaticus]
MKRATFRLQPVLELRRTEERTAAMAAAEAAQAAADADRRATEYETTLAASVLPRSLPAGQFLATMTLLRTAATDASDARAFATATAEQSELVRARWTAAAQRTKGLERLRERHLAALQHAEDAAEERAVDDLVTGRAGRSASRPADDRGGDPVDDGSQGDGSREVSWTQ